MIDDKNLFLIVDNDPENVKFLTESLGIIGGNVIAVSERQAALKYLTDNTADLIIINSVMRNLDIYKFLQELSMLSNAANVPLLILLTKKDELVDKLVVVPAMLVDYLILPFSIIDMYVRIRSLLQYKETCLVTINSSSSSSPLNRNLGKAAVGIPHEEDRTDQPDKIAFNSHLQKLLEKVNIIPPLPYNCIKGAIILVDIDNSKILFDSYGNEFSQTVIRIIEERLQEFIPEKYFFRTGSDEFSIIIENSNKDEYISLIAQKVLKAHTDPIKINESEISVTASIGISVFPDDGYNADPLIQHAETALHHSKQTGKNKYTFYNNISVGMSVTSPLQVKSIRDAIEQNEFIVYYQPIYKLNELKIAGFEALLRWSTNSFGNASPWSLIKYAEENGLMWEVGSFVLRKVCSFLNRVNEKYNSEIFVSMNISPFELLKDGFVADIKSIIYETGVNPKSLGMEFSEKPIIDSSEISYGVIRNLRSLGIITSLDDYGTGAMSIRDLITVPIDMLKLDGTILGNIDLEDRQYKLIKAIISIAEALNIRTSAKGVETQTQLNQLINTGCDYGQGYYLGKPQPEREAIKFLI